MPLGLRQHIGQQLAHAQHQRPTQLIGEPGRIEARQAGDHRIRHVPDIDRLEARGPGDHRHDRQALRHRGEAVEQRVLRPEHQRRPQDRRGREGRPHRLLACRLARPITTWTGRIGTDRGHLHQPRHAGGGRQPRHAPCPLALDALEVAGPPLRQNADQVHHQVGAFDRAMHRRLVLDRRVERHDLPNRAHRLEEQRCLRIAHCNPHYVPARRQPLDDIAANEPGPTEHCCYATRCHRRHLLSTPIS